MAAASPTLLELCLDAAASWEGWRYVQSQHNALRALPPELADPLLQRLLERSTLDRAPQQIERFAERATRVHLKGDVLGREVVAALVAPLASFQYLQELAITDAPCLMSGELAPLARLAGTLRALSLSGCGADVIKQSGTSSGFLSSLTGLESLDLSSYSIPYDAPPAGFDLTGVAALTRLTSLKLARLPVTDDAARGFGRLRQLRDLDLFLARLSLGFVERELVSLTRLTSLRLTQVGAGALPLFSSLRRLHLTICSTQEMPLLASVVPFGRSGDVMRLEEFILDSAHIDGPAAVALPQVLRASAPHLRTLVLGDCTLATGGSVLQLLSELVGATQLTCLSIGDCAADPADPPLPLAALGCTRLAELELNGPLVRASALGSFLRGVTSLRRLNVDLAESQFDDGCLRALAACPLPLLEELNASNTDLMGEFSSDSNPWRQLQGLRRLEMGGTTLKSQHALELLGDALGGALTSLTIGGDIEPDALGALCSRCAALRGLYLHDWRWHAAELEVALARLPRLERVVVDCSAGGQSRCSAPGLMQLAARLRPCTVTVCGFTGSPYKISEPSEMARLVEAVAEAAAEAQAAEGAAALAAAAAAEGEQ